MDAPRPSIDRAIDRDRRVLRLRLMMCTGVHAQMRRPGMLMCVYLGTRIVGLTDGATVVVVVVGAARVVVGAARDDDDDVR